MIVCTTWSTGYMCVLLSLIFIVVSCYLGGKKKYVSAFLNAFDIQSTMGKSMFQQICEFLTYFEKSQKVCFAIFDKTQYTAHSY